MTKEDIEKIAVEIGNTNNVDHSCPNNVRNPGLYFGAKLALEKIQQDRKDLIKASMDEVIQKHKDTFRRLKESGD